MPPRQKLPRRSRYSEIHPRCTARGSERKSKPVEFVTDVREDDMPEWFRCGVTAALLAPTAMNQQKFIFSLDGDKPTVRTSANGPFVRVDLGIVKYHFEAVTGKKVY